MSDIETIIERRKQLDYNLRIALATMQRKDTIYSLRQEILNNQKECPHVSDKYNWVVSNGTCPYCGMELG